MKKHIFIGLLSAIFAMAPFTSVLANSYPAVYNASGTPVSSIPTLAPAPTATPPIVIDSVCVSLTHNHGLGSSDAANKDGQVVALQNLLKQDGFFSLNATGYFGSITLQAVKAYQKAHGLPPTGFVGVLTRAHMNARLCQNPQPTSSINVVSPKAGDVLTRDTTTNITWSDSNTYIQAQKYDVSLNLYVNCNGRPCNMMALKPYTLATSTLLNSNGFAWKVGTSLEPDRQILDARYTITVCPSGGDGSYCAQSGVFTIGTPDPIATSTVISLRTLAPSSGPIGTKIHITTTSFSEVNHINFGTGYVPKSAITIGNGYVEFNAPSSLAPACYFSEPVHCMIASVMTPPNTYLVSITLNNGNNTNKLPFVLTSGTQ